MFPKILWMLWLQGESEAPDIVRACLSSWRRLNPGWTIRVLNRQTVPEYLPGLVDHKLPPTVEAQSNRIRIELLSRYGGVWADATCYCLKPLEEWLPPQLAPAGFFAFDRPGPERMLASWFLAAQPDSYIILRWLHFVNEYWKDRTEPEIYFWFHHLFRQAYEQDDLFRTLWDKAPKISADEPHCLTPYESKLLGPPGQEELAVLETARYPVLKLTHKINHAAGVAGTIYRLLCEREGLKPPDGGVCAATRTVPPDTGIAEAEQDSAARAKKISQSSPALVSMCSCSSVRQ